MQESPSRKKAPVPPAKWDKRDAAALQALERGDATADQQKHALSWIIYNACLTYDFEDRPEDDTLSAVFRGRRFAGLQIVKLVKINLSKLKE